MGLSRLVSYTAAPVALALVLAFVVGGAGARVFDEPGVVAYAPYQSSTTRAPVNTNLPAITGTAVVGQQLTGALGNWKRTVATTAYVWQRCDTNGAACANQPEPSLTYQLGAGDVGTRIRLVVTATSKFGVSTAASPLTAVVAPAPIPPPSGGSVQPPHSTAAPALSGTPVAGKTLSASPGSWTGDAPIAYRYAWKRCSSSCVSISGAASSQYTLSQADVGSQLAVNVVASNAAGTASATSPPTPPVVEPAPATPPTATNAPSISGTAQVGQTLTAGAGTWGGTTPLSVAYQWRRCDASGGSCTDVSSATGSTYAPTSGDVGATLRVAVTASNVAGSATSASAQTAVVVAAPAPPPPPTSTSDFRVGVIANVAGYGAPMQQKVLAIGAKLIREDRGDFAVAWAKANGITDDCIISLDAASAGANCPVVELDNEPYNNNVWINGDVNQWAKKALSVAQQVKAAHPNTTVLLPVGPPWNNGDVKEPNGTMRDCVLAINDAAPTIWNYVDGIAVHPYSQPASPVPGRFPVLDKWRSNLKAIGHGGLPFWVTEIGWPTSGTNWSPAQTQQQQSDYFAQFISTAKARSDVAAVIAYQLQDWGPRDTDSEHWFGLLNADGTSKLAYATLKQLIAANQ